MLGRYKDTHMGVWMPMWLLGISHDLTHGYVSAGVPPSYPRMVHTTIYMVVYMTMWIFGSAFCRKMQKWSFYNQELHIVLKLHYYTHPKLKSNIEQKYLSWMKWTTYRPLVVTCLPSYLFISFFFASFFICVWFFLWLSYLLSYFYGYS